MAWYATELPCLIGEAPFSGNVSARFGWLNDSTINIALIVSPSGVRPW
jgi:hypothetical protein